MRILLVEDDAMIREGVSAYLEDLGYKVVTAEDGEIGYQIFKEHQIDLVLLDIMLPKITGLELLTMIRRDSQVPVMMLTAMTGETTQVESFDKLADDYLCKPFSLVLLGKRVEALLRRQYRNKKIWTWGDAVVDFTAFSATYKGVDAQVKPKEIELLAALLAHPGQVLSRSQMLDQVWDDTEAPFERVIDTYIKNLRKKLGLDCIITVKGIGYKVEL